MPENRVFTFRCSNADRKNIQELARITGMKQSQLLRMMIRGALEGLRAAEDAAHNQQVEVRSAERPA